MNKESIKHIIPAILPDSYSELEEKLSMVASLVKWVQVDAVDGKFAPNRTWPYEHDSGNVFAKIVRQEEGLPFWEDVNFEIDLMVADPVFEADKWIAAGASRLVVHAASIGLEQFKELSKSIKDKGVELVLGVSMKDAIDTVRQYAEAAEEATGTPLDGIQCMGIQNIGFQHQEFDAGVISKIEEIKKLFPEIAISVDGGVSLDNARALYDAGASRLVGGSSVFDANMPGEAIEQFEEIAAMN